MESTDILLGKAKQEDWKAMYKNVWSHPETAQHMLWDVTENEADAQSRMARTIAFQKEHDSYLVYDKKSSEAIGFAGVEKLEDHVFQEMGIALGPRYVRKGYGKQILELLMMHCRELDGKEFRYFCRRENIPSKALARSCGFTYLSCEEKIDPRNGRCYILECYSKAL